MLPGAHCVLRVGGRVSCLIALSLILYLYNLLYLGLCWLRGHWSMAQFLHHNTLELHTDTPAASAACNVCQKYVVRAVDCCTAL